MKAEGPKPTLTAQESCMLYVFALMSMERSVKSMKT